MQINHGLMAGQVLQRDKAGRGWAQISGRCKADGDVDLRVLKAGRVLPGHDWKPAGTAAAKTFRAALVNLRSGGPYRVELRIRNSSGIAEATELDDIFVGDVWFLGGQSNMEGIGRLDHAPKPHPQVRSFYMRDEWGLAQEPLHYLGEAVDKVHNGYGDGPSRPSKAVLAKALAAKTKGVSPGLAFGLEMYKRTRVPQGLVACAHGGTSMAQWSPVLRDQGGSSLYGAMIRRYVKLGQPLAGVLWYQGESDANADAAPVYTERMIELVAASRRDMALPALPWLVVQLGCHASPEDGYHWNRIQEQQRHLSGVIRNLDVAPAIDLELDDGIHIGGIGQQILGRRLARLASRLMQKASGAKPSITVDGIDLVSTPGCRLDSGCMSVRIRYRHVAGGLISDGCPRGFSLHDEAGRDVCNVYKITVQGNAVILHTTDSRPRLEMLGVSYGHGRFPICNITDRDGMSLPAMQAVPVAPDRARQCLDWQTVRLDGVKSIAKVGFPKADVASGWHQAPPRNPFGVLPKPPTDDTTGVFALRTTLTADETLTAWLAFGANAPFKAWLNGALVLEDPACGIPMNPSQYSVELHLRRGQNRLLVVFAPPHAAGFFGIFASVGTRDGKIEPRLTF